MSASNLRELFIDELKDMYDAEQRVSKALPKLVEAAESEQLSSAFRGHLDETEEHVTRLEEIFDLFDETPTRKSCRAMIGLVEEGEKLMRENGGPGVRDAALIAAAQKMEHYEMATYGTLRTWATHLGNERASKILQKTLNEIGMSAQKLSSLADAIDGGPRGKEMRMEMNGKDENGSTRGHASVTDDDEDDDNDAMTDDGAMESDTPKLKKRAPRSNRLSRKR